MFTLCSVEWWALSVSDSRANCLRGQIGPFPREISSSNNLKPNKNPASIYQATSSNSRDKVNARELRNAVNRDLTC